MTFGIHAEAAHLFLRDYELCSLLDFNTDQTLEDGSPRKLHIKV
jgi:hypothetical protein